MECKNKLTVSEKIYNDLKESIINEKYLPGEHLIEADLVTEYKCSRSTIREALRYLVDDGLVELIPHKGIVVRKLTKKQILDICEVLYHLQPLLGHLAIKNGNDEKYSSIEEGLEAVEVFEYRKYFSLVSKFYLELASLCDNLMLKREMDYIYTLLRVNYRMMNFEVKDEYLLVCRKKILASLREKDEEGAIKLMLDNVNAIIAAIKKYY